MENFYKALYSSQIPENTFAAPASPFVNPNNIRRLDDEQQKTCEGFITQEECLSALKQLTKNKTPGSDGLTVEFYLYFWEYVKTPLKDCSNDACQRREMSISQRRGVFPCCQKRTDTLFLKFWRTITVLNNDYKNATKMYCKAARESLASVD